MTALLLLSLLGAAPAEKDVVAVSQQWAKLWTAKDLDAVMALYTEKATFTPVGPSKVVGRDAIRKFFKETLEKNTPNISFKSLGSTVSGDSATDHGEYDETITNAEGTKKYHGTYSISFKRENGRWLIDAQSWT